MYQADYIRAQLGMRSMMDKWFKISTVDFLFLSHPVLSLHFCQRHAFIMYFKVWLPETSLRIPQYYSSTITKPKKKKNIKKKDLTLFQHWWFSFWVATDKTAGRDYLMWQLCGNSSFIFSRVSYLPLVAALEKEKVQPQMTHLRILRNHPRTRQQFPVVESWLPKGQSTNFLWRQIGVKDQSPRVTQTAGGFGSLQAANVLQSASLDVLSTALQRSKRCVKEPQWKKKKTSAVPMLWLLFSCILKSNKAKSASICAVPYQNKVTTGHMHLGHALRSNFYYQAEKKLPLQVRIPHRELP